MDVELIPKHIELLIIMARLELRMRVFIVENDES